MLVMFKIEILTMIGYMPARCTRSFMSGASSLMLCIRWSICSTQAVVISGYTLENTEGAIQNGQSREIGNIG